VKEYRLSKHKDRLEAFIPLGFSTTGKDFNKDFLVTFIGEETIGDRRTLGLELTPKKDSTRAIVSKIRPLGYAALDVMERHLSERDFFVGGRYSIADIALYAYTHVAGEGGFELGRYAAIRAWLERVRTQPRYILITQEVGSRAAS
jgi:glutathione S-transferase